MSNFGQKYKGEKKGDNSLQKFFLDKNNRFEIHVGICFGRLIFEGVPITLTG